MTTELHGQAKKRWYETWKERMEGGKGDWQGKGGQKGMR